MKAEPQAEWRERRLRTIGRIGCAIAAGGAFAALAWEPPPASTPTVDAGVSKGQPGTAGRQSIVTEDGALPQLDAKSAGFVGEDQWGLAQTRPRQELWTTHGLGADALAGTVAGGFTPRCENEVIKTVTTAGVNPRGPP
ncbi:MAG: hypothetical protein JXQ75_22545 [Phycisphaerae bacterium]|nr:hypothetical protein [Phycisphaerae bacterium]